MRIINLTPHPVTLHLAGNGCWYGETRTVTIAPEQVPARMAQPAELSHGPVGVDVEDHAEFYIPAVEYARGGEIVGLPDPQRGVVYITSAMVAEAAQRADVMSPDVLTRDDAGNITGCRGLRAWTPLEGGKWS